MDCGLPSPVSPLTPENAHLYQNPLRRVLGHMSTFHLLQPECGCRPTDLQPRMQRLPSGTPGVGMLVLTHMSTPLRSIPTLPAWTRQPFFVSITLKCLFLWGRGKFHFPFIEHTSLSFRAGLTTVIPLLKISEHECFPDAPCNFQQVT